MSKLTRAQTEVLNDVLKEYKAGDIFRAEDLYPARNNQDNARRWTLRKLAELGYLVADPKWSNIYWLAL